MSLFLNFKPVVLAAMFVTAWISATPSQAATQSDGEKPTEQQSRSACGSILDGSGKGTLQSCGSADCQAVSESAAPQHDKELSSKRLVLALPPDPQKASTDNLLNLEVRDEKGLLLHRFPAVPTTLEMEDKDKIITRIADLPSDLNSRQTTILLTIQTKYHAKPLISPEQADRVKKLLDYALTELSSTDQATRSATMNRTTFAIPKMDCPSEEQMVRMAVRGQEDVLDLAFDLPGRRLVVTHQGSPEAVHKLIEPLGYGAQILGTEVLELKNGESLGLTPTNDAQESKVLKTLLAINGTMFVAEMGVGLLAGSTGLITDSLDMLADAAVYTVSLYAVGRPLGLQKRAAKISGYLQVGLALGALAEVARRSVYGSEPESSLMMAMSATALVANSACLYLIHKHRNGGVHMRASWIFSANDVIANLGVLAAGGLVAVTGSAVPDLVVGSVIGAIVLRGGWSILRLSR